MAEFSLSRVGSKALCIFSFIFALFLPISFLPRLAEAKVEPIQEVFEPAAPEPADSFLKVAVIQWAPTQMTPVGVSPEESAAAMSRNRADLAAMIRQAAQNGAKWVITPELSFVGYPDIPELPPEEDEFRNRADIAPYVEVIPGVSTAYFGELARELGIILQLGMAERDPVTDLYHNAVVIFSEDGSILAKYRKMNLYKTESEIFAPGDQAVKYWTPAGWAAPMICADIYSERPGNDLGDPPLSVIAVSASWAQWNTGMEHFQDAARFFETFILASNHRYFPDAGVINPDGSLQSHIRQTRIGIAYGYLPKAHSGLR